MKHAWRNPRACRSLLLATLAGLGWLAPGCGQGAGGGNPSGTLEATELRLAPALAARVLNVRVDEGQRVRQGDTLLVLDLSTQHLQRAQSAAGLATLAAKVKRAEAISSELESAQRLAGHTLTRITSMHQAGSATDQQLDEALAQREQTTSRVVASRHEQESLRAERAALEATLAVQDRILRDGVLLSPISGTVLERYVEPGEWVAPGQPAMLLADLARLELRFYLGERELGQVRPGMGLRVRADAWPAEEFPATVSWISSEAEFTPKNAQTRDSRAQLVYAVRALVANGDGRLLIGMPAEALLEGAKR